MAEVGVAGGVVPVTTWGGEVKGKDGTRKRVYCLLGEPSNKDPNERTPQ